MTDEQTERDVLEALARDRWGWDFAPKGVNPDEWVKRWNRFRRMLDAGAYLDAAMMLVPDGWENNMSLHWSTDNERNIVCTAVIGWVRIKAEADTPALALAAAIARAGK